jgi:hypothetical protein
MTRRKYAAGLGAIACLLTSTAAFAADATRSSTALPAPSALKTLHAPTQGLRTATPLKKKSNAIAQGAAIGIGLLATAAVVAGVVVATDTDDEADISDSPG